MLFHKLLRLFPWHARRCSAGYGSASPGRPLELVCGLSKNRSRHSKKANASINIQMGTLSPDSSIHTSISHISFAQRN